jgi:hypothetical protein
MDEAVDPRVAILEELRTADRIVAGAIATLRHARRAQGLDFLGMPSHDGPFESQTQSDNASATSSMLEAEGVLRRVEKRLALPPTTGEVEVAHWNVWSDLAGGVFDLISLAKLSSNIDTAIRLQTGIRGLFERLRTADAALATRVEPLANWDDGPSEIATAWQFNRTPMIILGVLVVAFLIAMFS